MKSIPHKSRARGRKKNARGEGKRGTRTLYERSEACLQPRRSVKRRPRPRRSRCTLYLKRLLKFVPVRVRERVKIGRRAANARVTRPETDAASLANTARRVNVDEDAGAVFTDEQSTILLIDELQQAGISATDVNKLKAAGFSTIRQLVMFPRKNIVAVKGFSDAKADKVLESALKMLPESESGGFITAAEDCERRKGVLHITCGAAAVDAILNGGFETRAITEIFGEWRCGKTQICHTLAVTTQMPIEMGGGCSKVAWIDTENTFRSDRLEAIADRFGLDRDAVLSNVMVARVDTVDQMMQALIAIGAKMAEEPFKLLIVDSIMAIFRVDYVARGELSERQQTLNQFLSRLRKLAEEFNVAVVLTNQVQSDPGGMAFAGVEPKKPIGGHVLAHASTIRLQVRKGRAEARVIKVLQGPTLKEDEAEFQITEGGVAGME